MLTEADKDIIKRSWRLVVPIAETAADLFYKRLFELKPSYRAMFKSDMDAQKRKLIAMLAFIVKSLDWPESAWQEDIEEENDLFLVVLALGRRHSGLYEIPDESYDTVGEALIWTLDMGLGKAFDEPTRAAWSKVYGLLATTMKMGRLSVAPTHESDAMVARVVTGTNAGGAGVS
jgi:hemoglobin-like flavoprotein